MFQRVMNFLGLGPDDEEGEEGLLDEVNEEPELEPFPSSRRPTVVSLHTQKQVRVILAEPASYDDAQMIADHLKAHRSVIVNLHRSPYDQALRVVDFLSGCVYALGGNMQKLGHNIFLCAPDNVDIQGTISEYLAGEARSHLR
ncbi:MAG: cell division protein SepF [Firmicutes bacterium]|nr:cell division protein SepF [Bacillota bacterium]